IRQGLRAGFSAYRGPYLYRGYQYYLPGEARPRDLPATGIGVDAEWASGHWNVRGEWQHFVMDYRLIPVYRQTAAYGELKRVLHPRWFIAARAGYLHTTYASGAESYDAAIGYRPNRTQLVKVGYQVNRLEATGQLDRLFLLQVVTSLHPLSVPFQ